MNLLVSVVVVNGSGNGFLVSNRGSIPRVSYLNTLNLMVQFLYRVTGIFVKRCRILTTRSQGYRSWLVKGLQITTPFGFKQQFWVILRTGGLLVLFYFVIQDTADDTR